LWFLRQKHGATEWGEKWKGGGNLHEVIGFTHKKVQQHVVQWNNESGERRRGKGRPNTIATERISRKTAGKTEEKPSSSTLTMQSVGSRELALTSIPEGGGWLEGARRGSPVGTVG